MLQAQAQPSSLAALAAMTGAHPNTVREHLEGLRADDLVRRFAAPAAGRGRPRWLYEATQHSHDDPRPEYAGLAVALASVIARTSATPGEDARNAGVEWGRQLAESVRVEGTAPARRSPWRAVTDLLDQLGFGAQPEKGAYLARLTRCPLLEAAHQAPEIVCSVHQGLAEGALEVFGASPEGVRLLPFAEPSACVLRLEATS